jgi:hypothetical protein
MQPELTCQTSLVEDIGETDGFQDMFSKVWPAVTDPNPLVLFGFRRFRTSHLLNLRALEHEILEIDHQVFQAGLQLGRAPKRDRLALDHAEKDTLVPVLDRERLERLRSLLQQYGKHGSIDIIKFGVEHFADMNTLQMKHSRPSIV